MKTAVGLPGCHFAKLRSASRRLTQSYDAALAPSGIRPIWLQVEAGTSFLFFGEGADIRTYEMGYDEELGVAKRLEIRPSALLPIATSSAAGRSV